MAKFPPVPYAHYLPLRIAPYQATLALTQARTLHAASAGLVRIMARVLLRERERCRAQALARGDFAAMARCEDAIIWHELYVDAPDRDAPA